jgi:BirA family biotin operon repressor/biotin-[acetyl-CoA-carboxylase] ligase
MTSDEQIAAVLGDRPFRFYETIDSTNDVAIKWLREGAPTGAVVLADEQTRGRGRLGRSWHTPPGSALAMSVILRPQIDTLTRLSLLGALAVAEAVERIGVSGVGVKWPNDVQIDGGKVCGILPEAAWDDEVLAGVVLGIGVNFSVDFSDTELAGTAVSLEPVLGRTIDRFDLLARILARIDAWTSRLDDPALVDGWRGRLNMLGQPVRVMMPGDRVIAGTAETVDAEGALLVRAADGSVQRALVGDVVRES